MAEATAARLLGYLHSSPIERLLRTIVTSVTEMQIGLDKGRAVAMRLCLSSQHADA